jgi:hypothetical protein
MSDAFVQLAPDQTGKKVQSALNATEHAQYAAAIDATGFSNAYVQIGEGSGKKMRTFLNTIGGNAVHALAICPVDSSGNPIS